MLLRLPHKSELEKAARGTKFNSSTARQKTICSADVLKVCVLVIANTLYKTAMSLIRACSLVHQKCAIHCVLTMHFPDFVNALVKIMLWELECLCVLLLQYLE